MGPIPFTPFRNYPPQHEDDIIENDNISSSDDSRENEDSRRNKYYNRSSYMLFTPTLEDLKNVLYVALNPYFEEFEIAVVSCPCLTREPYNLAAAGLSDNTSILKIGTLNYFYPIPRTNFAINIQNIFSRDNYDVFVIGSGFAAQPSMSYNGHLTMNAVVSTNHRNINNNSCIAYKHASTGQTKSKIINDYNQIKCCIFGQFFFSGGKRGPVIKMRAKGRRSRSSIIALIQAALTNRCQYQSLIGLGIVLIINGGRTEQRFLTDDFVSRRYNIEQDYCNQLNRYGLNCENLIALGTLISKKLWIYTDDYERLFLRDSCSMFNTFSNYESVGEFFNDLTPEETEYIVYINTAQDRCFVM
ncbi:hypothetical protein ACFW04_005121 [Cataglyphis niger]